MKTTPFNSTNNLKRFTRKPFLWKTFLTTRRKTLITLTLSSTHLQFGQVNNIVLTTSFVEQKIISKIKKTTSGFFLPRKTRLPLLSGQGTQIFPRAAQRPWRFKQLTMTAPNSPVRGMKKSRALKI